jgi:hypothetical protein
MVALVSVRFISFSRAPFPSPKAQFDGPFTTSAPSSRRMQGLDLIRQTLTVRFVGRSKYPIGTKSGFRNLQVSVLDSHLTPTRNAMREYQNLVYYNTTTETKGTDRRSPPTDDSSTDLKANDFTSVTSSFLDLSKGTATECTMGSIGSACPA